MNTIPIGLQQLNLSRCEAERRELLSIVCSLADHAQVRDILEDGHYEVDRDSPVLTHSSAWSKKERRRVIDAWREIPTSAVHAWVPDSHWDDHPEHEFCDWRAEVVNGDTRQGYVDWVNSRIEQQAHED